MASDGFSVMPGDLHEAAGDYKAQAEAIRQAGARFTSAAGLPDSAFGNLQQSAALARQYQEFRKQVTQDVATMYQALASGSATLTANAAAYQAADLIAELYLNDQADAGQPGEEH
jgi:uncharacterized protein YukE